MGAVLTGLAYFNALDTSQAQKDLTVLYKRSHLAKLFVLEYPYHLFVHTDLLTIAYCQREHLTCLCKFNLGMIFLNLKVWLRRLLTPALDLLQQSNRPGWIL